MLSYHFLTRTSVMQLETESGKGKEQDIFSSISSHSLASESVMNVYVFSFSCLHGIRDPS